MLTYICSQDEIRTTSRDAAPDVDSWIEHAKALQDDIEISKRLASEIIRQAESDEHREDLVNEQQTYLAFMESEYAFNKQLHDALSVIQEVSECLERTEALLDSRQILPCLTALESRLGPHGTVPTVMADWSSSGLWLNRQNTWK